ncbi:MAG: glycosyltransferase [Lentimicrobium sp.]
MKLSIIIVNYNVEFFLEQCLHSVKRACKNIEAEIWVVDNNSVDGSLKMLKEKFPEVNVIANKENLGFAKANNQAIHRAHGEYILLLNPDTVVAEDTFEKTVAFMDAHPDAGGLGVKMVDGKGKFLKESKRGLPTPSVAFFKMVGLTKIFPHNPLFARYYLGHLSDDEIHEVEILSGAFMLLRREVLQITGLLDEDYFMYGEDIDLSYRILKAGYKNYYFPHTRIIHYKGESTRKSSLNYVFTFYQAMAIFAKKHFSAGLARRFNFFINLAIFFRAGLSLLRRFTEYIFLPLLDTALVYGGIIIMKNYWEGFIFQGYGEYPPLFVYIMLPAYILIWLFSVYLSGGYDKPFHLSKVFQGIALGTVIILAAYALLPANLRFSRALILFGALWAIMSMTLIRVLLHFSGIEQYRLAVNENKRFLIVGKDNECNRVAEILRNGIHRPAFIGFVASDPLQQQTNGFVGNLSQLNEIIRIYGIDEIVFCANDISAQYIIDQMLQLHDKSIELKIAPPESYSIIGSNSISTSNDPFIIDISSINSRRNRRNKRIADLILVFLLLLTLPFNIWWVEKKSAYLKNIFFVLFGRKTWVGIKDIPGVTNPSSIVKPGILCPTDAWPTDQLTPQTALNLNLLYARNYRPLDDFNIVLKAFRKLGHT